MAPAGMVSATLYRPKQIGRLRLPRWLRSAITCRWRSRQNFARRIALDDRFTATNSDPALAQPGDQAPFVGQIARAG